RRAPGRSRDLRSRNQSARLAGLARHAGADLQGRLRRGLPRADPEADLAQLRRRRRAAHLPRQRRHPTGNQPLLRAGRGLARRAQRLHRQSLPQRDRRPDLLPALAHGAGHPAAHRLPVRQYRGGPYRGAGAFGKQGAGLRPDAQCVAELDGCARRQDRCQAQRASRIHRHASAGMEYRQVECVAAMGIHRQAVPGRRDRPGTRAGLQPDQCQPRLPAAGKPHVARRRAEHRRPAPGRQVRTVRLRRAGPYRLAGGGGQFLMRDLALLGKTLMLLACGLLVMSLSMRIQAQTEPPKRLLFIAAAPVQAGKFERLKPLASAAGFALDYRMLDGASGSPSMAELNAHDLLVIDAPYGAALGTVQMSLGPLLDAVQAPWLWLRRDGSRGRQVPDALIADLDLYYSNGGVANFNGFFCRLQAQFAGEDGAACPAPDIHPQAGIYHPQANGRIFTSLDDFLAWKGVELRREVPLIGVLFHKAYMDSGLTGFVDDTLR